VTALTTGAIDVLDGAVELVTLLTVFGLSSQC
jgi:hypothetical protein